MVLAHPSQPAWVERLVHRETAGLSWVDVDGIGAGEAVGSSEVEVGRWLRDARKEIGVVV